MTFYTSQWDYEKRLKAVDTWKIPESEKAGLKAYAKEYASGRITGRIGKNIQASVEGALLKLKLPLTFINKPFDDIQREDLCLFVDSLMQDKIKKRVRKRVNGKLVWVTTENYAKKGKDKFLKNLALYLKFRLENQPKRLAVLLKVVKVIVTHVKREPTALTYTDFDKIYDSCSDLCSRYYLIVNAWGGFRASEFHGVTESDIILPDIQKGAEYVKIWIKYANSKTKGRMVTLYGPQCHSIVRQYLEKRRTEGLRPDEQVFEKTHNAVKLWLRRLGVKYALPLHPHIFRSTCATWLVDKAILKSYADLVEFFGWSYGSTVPNMYLNRSGIHLSHIDKDVKQSRLEELKLDLEKQKEIERLQRIEWDRQAVELKSQVDALLKDREQTHALIKTLIEKYERR
jgi:integrase